MGGNSIGWMLRATGNERWPTIDRRNGRSVDGMVEHAVGVLTTSEVGDSQAGQWHNQLIQTWWSAIMQHAKHHNSHLKVDPRSRRCSQYRVARASVTWSKRQSRNIKRAATLRTDWRCHCRVDSMSDWVRWTCYSHERATPADSESSRRCRDVSMNLIIGADTMGHGGARAPPPLSRMAGHGGAPWAEVGGTVKKISGLPPLLKCFRRQWWCLSV